MKFRLLENENEKLKLLPDKEYLYYDPTYKCYVLRRKTNRTFINTRDRNQPVFISFIINPWKIEMTKYIDDAINWNVNAIVNSILPNNYEVYVGSEYFDEDDEIACKLNDAEQIGLSKEDINYVKSNMKNFITYFVNSIYEQFVDNDEDPINQYIQSKQQKKKKH